jgi:hypothetical protein
MSAAELFRLSFYEDATDPATGAVTRQHYKLIYYDTGAPARVDGAAVTLVSNAEALAQAKVDRIAEIRAKREAVISGGVTTPSGVVNSDVLSITRNIPALVQDATIANVALLALDPEAPPPEPWSTVFRFADNSLAPVDAAEMIAIGQAVREHVTASYARGWTLEAAVGAAGTMAALAAIDIDAGWPE